MNEPAMNEPVFFPPSPYVSPERSISLLARLVPSLHFYPRLLHILIDAGIQAQKQHYSGKDWANSSEHVARCLEDVGCRFDVQGIEHVRDVDGPCVIAGNHMSTLETMVLPCMIQPWREVTFVIKRSLFKYPFFKAVLTARNPICVDRKSPRDDLKTVLEEGEKRLRSGTSIIIFPQSTRMLGFDPAKFNSIAVKLAKRAGVPIVPLALSSSAWSEGRLLHDFGSIHPERLIRFRFGAPFSVQDSGKPEQARLCEFISGTLDAWTAEQDAPAKSSSR